jgi:hypothetical protein
LVLCSWCFVLGSNPWRSVKIRGSVFPYILPLMIPHCNLAKGLTIDAGGYILVTRLGFSGSLLLTWENRENGANPLRSRRCNRIRNPHWPLLVARFGARGKAWRTVIPKVRRPAQSSSLR